MACDPKDLGKALEAGASKNTKPKPAPQRLGYKSNARNPERMSPANVQSTNHPSYAESVKKKNDPLPAGKARSIRGIF